MRVLVTGANGMLATNIVEQLLEKGYCVRGLLRRVGSYKGGQHPNLELVEGDFTKLDSASAAIDGCDFIVHSAAVTAQNLLDYESYRSVNVCATEQLVKVAIERGVKRFLYVSSANTIGYGTLSSPSSEDAPMMPPFSNSLYARSKREGEDVVLSYRDTIDVVVVNPTFMIGKYGAEGGSNRLLKMVRRVVISSSGGKSFIDVEDAASATIAALERGRRGEKYLISGENMSFPEFFRLFKEVHAVVVVPRFILLSVGFVGSQLRRFGVRGAASLVDMQSILINPGYCNDKMRRELGFVPRKISEMNPSDLIRYR